MALDCCQRHVCEACNPWTAFSACQTLPMSSIELDQTGCLASVACRRHARCPMMEEMSLFRLAKHWAQGGGRVWGCVYSRGPSPHRPEPWVICALLHCLAILLGPSCHPTPLFLTAHALLDLDPTNITRLLTFRTRQTRAGFPTRLLPLAPDYRVNMVS